jgi:hypothetical protein
MRDRALDALIEGITVDAYGDEGCDALDHSGPVPTKR